MSAAQAIARNIRRLRRANNWTQAEAAERYSALSGARVTNAAWSQFERSAESERVRAFTANEIAAFADLFQVTPGELFDPPPIVPCPQCDGTGKVFADGRALDEATRATSSGVEHSEPAGWTNRCFTPNP